MKHTDIIIIYLVCINILGFFLMAADKRRAARHRHHRIPEAVLLFISLLGGSAGTFLAMHLCRHKSLKAKFYIGLPVMVFVQALVIILFGTVSAHL